MNPVFLNLGALKLYYYGACYAAGFLVIFLWILSRRDRFAWSKSNAYDFAITFALSVLVCGRMFEVFVYEWDLYREAPSKIPRLWEGGMASHGVLLGASLGTILFAWIRGTDFLRLIDEVVIPGAILMALGRLGNFINAEIYGPLTDGWWGMHTPYASGLRHPVTLYDSIKNLAVAGIILIVERHTLLYRGKRLAHFLLWYGGLRLFVDYFRDYESYFLGIGTGQYYNLAMACIGLGLIIWFRWRAKGVSDVYAVKPVHVPETKPLWPRRTVFAALVFFALLIPSGWSQEWLALRKNKPTLAPDK